MHSDSAANSSQEIDLLFQQAVEAIDAGDEDAVQNLLDDNPFLAVERLRWSGEWLTKVIGPALQSFFKDPFLLWFVSEDAPRNHKLPANIATIASIIIDKIKAADDSSLQIQLDYGLKLVAWSVVARKSATQNELLDVFIDAGAKFKDVVNDALVNGNFEAARHLINRGATMTLPAALCLDEWDKADELLQQANQAQKQFSLTLTSLHGRPAAIKKLITHGADVNQKSDHLYSHATPLHHAVSSGSLDAVKLLVEAGADIHAVDTAFNGTPLGWAQYGNWKETALYLKSAGGW